MPSTATLDRDLDDVVRDHMPLVAHVVREVLARLPRHVSGEDLTAAGLAALVVAARTFDPARGASFPSYARQRVRGAVLDELRVMDWASRSVRRRQRELDRARSSLATELGRTPTPAEVAARIGISAAAVVAHDEDVIRATVVSLQGLGEAPLEELLPGEAPDAAQLLVQRELVAYLHDAVELLPERLRAVVTGYFFAERPMAELAAELGVTESRISQMRAEALSLLRAALRGVDRSDQEPATTTPRRLADRRRAAYCTAVARHRTARARLSESRVALTG